MITQVKTGIVVKDQERALDFYVNKLGFEKRRDVPYDQTGARWIEVSIPGTRTTLILGQGDGSESHQGGPRLVIEAENIQELYETWRDRGVTFTDPPNTQPWGTQAVFVDSEDKVLVLVQSWLILTLSEPACLDNGSIL